MQPVTPRRTRRPRGLVAPEVAQAAEHARFGVLADGARVQQDDVGRLGPVDPLVAMAPERAEDELRVGHVHLAAVRLDVDGRHGGRLLAGARGPGNPLGAAGNPKGAPGLTCHRHRRYGRRVPQFRRHAVCSPLTLASEIGLQVLRDGGNAADAAIATNLALAVAYPHMCGVGGDLFAHRLGRRPPDRAQLERPPARRRATLPADGVPQRGIGSATVPGAAAGWCALAERFGTRTHPRARRSRRSGWRATASCAARGSPASPSGRRGCSTRDAEAARIFLAPDRLVQPELAHHARRRRHVLRRARSRCRRRRRSRPPTSRRTRRMGRADAHRAGPASRSTSCRRTAADIWPSTRSAAWSRSTASGPTTRSSIAA